MLKRLFARSDPAPPRQWRAPEGARIYAIGDIHGRLDLFDDVCARIDADDRARARAATELILLGDLVDRGEDSCGVIERAIALAQSRSSVRMLKGNHEEVLINLWDGNDRLAGLFHRIGGRATMLSYGMTPGDYDALDLAALGEAVRTVVPSAHIEFLRGFDDWVLAGDYLFVHAGIRPNIPIEEQNASDLRWIRGDFTGFSDDFGMMVVHGHTISETIEERPNRIGIDTGAFATGVLSAIGVEGSERWFIDTR